MDKSFWILLSILFVLMTLESGIIVALVSIVSAAFITISVKLIIDYYTK